jgi:ATPases involved in chromosome partitioning
MDVIALMSQKGGAGKSTLALHLAAEAAVSLHRILLLDLDPQGNLVGWAQRRGERPPDVEGVHPSSLARVLETARGEGYDRVFLDTAPTADRTTMLAAQSADLVVVPCRPAQFDLDAMDATLATLKMLARPAVVVLNAAPVRSRITAEARELLTGKGALVAPVVVHQRVALQHCLTTGQTAAEYDPGCTAAREVGLLYDNLMACIRADTTTRKVA